MYHFLFPSSPVDYRKIDPMFEDQAEALKKKGFGCSLITFGHKKLEIIAAKFVLISDFKDLTIVYRGWLLTPLEYTLMLYLVHEKKGKMLTSQSQHQVGQELDWWQHRVTKYTAETVICHESSLAEVLASLDWGKFFVKDMVKSLKTGFGSVLTGPEDAEPFLADMRKYNASTFNGWLAVRRFETLHDERRAFVLNGVVYTSQTGAYTDLAHKVAAKIKLPFYAMDIATNEKGEARLVEIGDGQMTDISYPWDAKTFAEMWAGHEELKAKIKAEKEAHKAWKKARQKPK